jgi:hypothetical protein
VITVAVAARVQPTLRHAVGVEAGLAVIDLATMMYTAGDQDANMIVSTRNAISQPVLQAP